jgi:hypothetical protein
MRAHGFVLAVLDRDASGPIVAGEHADSGERLPL